MPKPQNPAAELEQIRRDREAIRAQEQQLANRERAALQRLKAERAKILADAFSAVDVGDISKADAARLARHIVRLGIGPMLDLIEQAQAPEAGGNGRSAEPPAGSSDTPPAPPASSDKTSPAGSESAGSTEPLVELAA